MSDLSDLNESKRRNGEDRAFLHDLSTPLAILKHSVAKFEAESRASGDADSDLKRELILSRMKDAVAKMERIHGDFKMVVYDREMNDGGDPLDKGLNRRI